MFDTPKVEKSKNQLKKAENLNWKYKLKTKKIQQKRKTWCKISNVGNYWKEDKKLCPKIISLISVWGICKWADLSFAW